MGNNIDQRQQENYIAGGALQGSDLAEREKDIVVAIASKSGFKPDHLISRSSWWDPKGPIGAFHYAGTFQDKPAILKIQGVKPNSSEAYHIDQFQKRADTSEAGIRPPHLYFHAPWEEAAHYEALILEALNGSPIVHVPATDHQLSTFFQAYREYKKIPKDTPWVAVPEEPLAISIQSRIRNWQEISLNTFPDHPLRKSSDAQLVDRGIHVLTERARSITPEFQHGHFSHIDVFQADDGFVVLSNLYWSWRLPLYDAIFAYHWHRFSLPGVPGIQPSMVDQQNALWRSHIDKIPQEYGYSDDALKTVLLERALAGVVLDGLSADRNHPVTAYIMDSLRNDINSLISELS